MDLIAELLPLALAMMLTGAVGGLLAGLLGVGGGIVIVPVLDATLGFMDVDTTIRMHVAVATSLATIIPTSIASSRAHYGQGAVDIELAKRWAPFILAGSVVGTIVATAVDSDVLSMVFGAVALIVAVKMLLPLEGLRFSETVPRGIVGPMVPLGIGSLSSMMGIGGGTLSVPVLTLMNQPIHRSIGTAAFFGLLISSPGTLGYVLTGWGDERLPPGSLGYVNVIGFLLISPVTVMFAPLGAKLAHKLNKQQLGLAFGVFLLVVSVRMLLRAFG